MFIAYIGALGTWAYCSLGFLILLVGFNTGCGGNILLGTVGSTLLFSSFTLVGMTWMCGINVYTIGSTLSFPPFTLVDMTEMCVIGVSVVETGGFCSDWVFRYPGRRGVFSLGVCNTVVLLLLTL